MRAVFLDRNGVLNEAIVQNGLSNCRKPCPGMLQNAARHHKVELNASFMIGNRWRDVEAGCRTILIGSGYGEGVRSKSAIAVRTLTDAGNCIIADTQRL
jgi:D-glycero-D-manno-heptose 1,7-bisphosphate phosphatase